MLVADKADLSDGRTGSTREGEQVAREDGIPVFKVPAKTGEGIERALAVMTAEMVRRVRGPPPLLLEPSLHQWTIKRAEPGGIKRRN
jgi:hypothetical protein